MKKKLKKIHKRVVKRLKRAKIPETIASLPDAAKAMTDALPIPSQKSAEEKMHEALASAPTITNETVTEHREEVLKSARKYIYPLAHPKRHIVSISITLFITILVGFLIYAGLALYRFKANDGFIYGVTQVVPFPIAKVDGHFVSYEAYLFELRRNMHYYETQQQANFKDPKNKAQLVRLEQQSMDRVIQDSYVSDLAKKNNVTVSDAEVNNEVAIVRSQNRLGSSDKVFKEVLSQFWGWDESDFKRELKSEMLSEAVSAKLDTQTTNRAQNVLNQLHAGGDFASLAKKYSADASTSGNGGQYSYLITANTSTVSPIIVNELFKLKAGQISSIVNTGSTLEILKLVDGNPQTGVHAAHIQFNIAPITNYTAPLQKSEPPHYFIHIN